MNYKDREWDLVCATSIDFDNLTVDTFTDIYQQVKRTQLVYGEVLTRISNQGNQIQIYKPGNAVAITTSYPTIHIPEE